MKLRKFNLLAEGNLDLSKENATLKSELIELMLVSGGKY